MIVRNPDERLRDLQRAAAEGGPEERERFYREAARTGDCQLIGEALFELGPKHALAVITPPKRFTGPDRHELRREANAVRDNQAICLGLHLVQLGFLPNIPVVHFSSYGSGFEYSMKGTAPRWVNLPASVPGRARRRRFRASYGFLYQTSWGNEEGIDRQTPEFLFKIEPLGKNWHAEEYVRSLGIDRAARLVAPEVQFLARWDRSSAFTRPWGGQARADVSGINQPLNALYFWGRSDPNRPQGPYDHTSPDDEWRFFLDMVRAGVVPGEDVPPRAPNPCWTVDLVEEWIFGPRADKIRALFYADLWLAGLLVPGSEVGYDPITGGPAVKQNPPWRRNMSRLSGPAVEQKHLLEIFEPYWSKIRSVSARSLNRPVRGFVPDIRDESRLLGCGAWGCVWRTADKRFALKVSLDATEGPIIAQIMAKRQLRLDPGCVYYHKIWQLPELVKTNTYGYAPAYVILREECAPVDWLDDNGDVRKKYTKIHLDLEDLPDACCNLVQARCNLEWDASVTTADEYIDAEKEFMEYVFDLRTTVARHVGTFMARAYEAGILLGDVHPGNVGIRKHNLRQFGVPRHKEMLVTDVGDEGQAVCSEDQHPKIRRLKNMPAFACHPRHPAVMDYWTRQIPFLPM